MRRACREPGPRRNATLRGPGQTPGQHALWLGVFLCCSGAGMARAGGPRAEYSTIPPFVRVVGHTGGIVDASGSFTVVARDMGNERCPNVQVVVDFSSCPDLRLCAIQPGQSTVDCGARTVRGFTAADGTVTFVVLGAGSTVGGIPGAGSGAVRVFADGFPLGTMTAIVYDLNGAIGTPGLEVTDLSAFLRDLGTGQYYGRSDWSEDGTIDVLDLSKMVTRLGAGTSVSGAELCE